MLISTTGPCRVASAGWGSVAPALKIAAPALQLKVRMCAGLGAYNWPQPRLWPPTRSPTHPPRGGFAFPKAERGPAVVLMITRPNPKEAKFSMQDPVAYALGNFRSGNAVDLFSRARVF